jgi:hypothetical protein
MDKDMKYIEVESCLDCPYHQKWTSGKLLTYIHACSHRCWNVTKTIIEETPSKKKWRGTTPVWCPLPNLDDVDNEGG